jgi:hypothetical protein
MNNTNNISNRNNKLGFARIVAFERKVNNLYEKYKNIESFILKLFLSIFRKFLKNEL